MNRINNHIDDFVDQNTIHNIGIGGIYFWVNRIKPSVLTKFFCIVIVHETVRTFNNNSNLSDINTPTTLPQNVATCSPSVFGSGGNSTRQDAVLGLTHRMYGSCDQGKRPVQDRACPHRHIAKFLHSQIHTGETDTVVVHINDTI